MKKIKKSTLKNILPSELYVNSMLGKRGHTSEFTKSINTKFKPKEYEELTELLLIIGVKKSAFIRYAIAQAKETIEKKLSLANEE